MSKYKVTSDPRIVYVLLALVVTVPILTHAVLPVPISDTTRAVFDFIDKLPANNLVILSFDYSTSVVPELHPQAIVVTQHVFLRPLKIIFVAQYQDGPALTDAVLDAINKGNKTYGVDYATLGFIPNTATLIGMTSSFQAYFPVDTHGASTNSLPIIKQFPAGKMASLLVTFAAGDPGLELYLQYWQTPFNTPIAAGATATRAPGYEPFYNAHQIVGLLISMRAAAEYEFLLNQEYQVPLGISGATSAMVAQSASQMLIVAMVVVGNLAYFVNSRRSREATK
jgi:hypothetical protein